MSNIKFKIEFENNIIETIVLYMRELGERLPGATMEIDEWENDEEVKPVIMLEPHDTIYLPNGAVYADSDEWTSQQLNTVERFCSKGKTTIRMRIRCKNCSLCG
jgi:hypothetical protein